MTMHFKTRVILLLVIFFMFFVSFKIMEPELGGQPDGLSHRLDSDYSMEHIDYDRAVLGAGQQANVSAVIQEYVERYMCDIKAMSSESSLWTVAGDWVHHRQIHPEFTPEMGAILHKMATSRITRAGLGYRGTQLKMSLTLEGGQRVAFKPKWYERDDVVSGKPYDGPDRHNGEIAAFHLNRVLGYRRSPLVVGRVVDMENEIRPVAEQPLLDTFYYKGDDVCFYGKCMYCKGQETGVCGAGSRLEGAVVLWLPSRWKFKNWRHPWGRTYREDLRALWETDEKYCGRVRHTDPYTTGPRLMDILDAAVFDYLISNADRHHYETIIDHPDSILVMMDSAKSFGNPHTDEVTILAPLYQCCRLRKETWKRLNQLKGGALSSILRQILARDPIAPILAEPHYEAMDRRLLFILQTVKSCVQKHGADKVFVVDDYASQYQDFENS